MKHTDRERMAHEMQVQRELYKTDIEFVKSHPHDRVTGERMATRYVEQATACSAWMEKYIFNEYKDDGTEKPPMPLWDGDAIFYEVQPFLTPEQLVHLDTINARKNQYETEQKAKNYDELLEAMERSGLGEDWLMGPDPDNDKKYKSTAIITIENRELAKRWFTTAHSWEDQDDEDDTDR